MTEAQISLMKTLCAMRWIALMNDNHTLAATIQKNINYLESSTC